MERIRLGLIASGLVPEELASQLARDLPPALAQRVSRDIEWEVPVVTDRLAAVRGATGTSMIDEARRRMLQEGWDLAIVLTDLPLHIGRRPVVADASATHGVALVSLPALGAVQRRRRAVDAIVRLVGGLTGESLRVGERSAESRARVSGRLREMARSVHRVTPEDDDVVDVRFVAAVIRGNLRLLAGMVRANRPWRLAVGLSRALAAAVAAGAFALVTDDIWKLALTHGGVRLALLTIVSLAGTIVALIVVHGLWERATSERAQEQVVLFNVATALTLALGVVALYGALFVMTLLGAALVLNDEVIEDAVRRPVDFWDYVKLAWMVASIATIGGALGSALESDAAVREAAYGYRPEREAERDSRAD